MKIGNKIKVFEPPEYQLAKLNKADEMIHLLSDIRSELIMVNAKLDNIKKKGKK